MVMGWPIQFDNGPCFLFFVFAGITTEERLNNNKKIE